VADDRLDRLDYYTLLGLEPGATADQIRDAFHVFAMKFHPDRHVGGGDAKIERAEEIFRRGAEAYRVLLDSMTRKRYDAGLQKGRLRFDPDFIDEDAYFSGQGTASVKLTSAKSRPFVAKAQQAFRDGDFKAARLNLKIALTHEPGHPVLMTRLDEVERRLKGE